MQLMGLEPRILSDPAFRGREKELEELTFHLDAAIEGKGSTIFVSGEAGSGKSRLTKEFLKRARKKDLTILSGYCLSSVTMPYFPFIEAFTSHVRNERTCETTDNPDFSSGIKNLLMGLERIEKAGTQEILSPQVWKDLAFAAVANELLNQSTLKPTIVFIDDLHWADSASLSLIHYISRTVRSKRILVLGTFRSEELTKDGEGHPHPLAELLRVMGREELYSELTLRTFGEEIVGKIAEDMIGGHLDPNLVRKLAKDSQGNALFVIESLRMLAESGNLAKRGGLWSLIIDELGIPNKFKDIILRRLTTLKSHQRRVLDVASVIGEKFNPDLLALTLSSDTLDILEALSSISESTSLVLCEGDLYRFYHAKSRDVVYEEIPALLRKGYHNRIAQKLESAGRGSGTLPFSEIAYHYVEAGSTENAVKYALMAGKNALDRFSNSEAVKHFRYVIQALTDDISQVDKRTIALQGLGEAFYNSNRFIEAMKTFEQIYSFETGIAQLRAFRWAMDSAFFQGDTPRLLELSQKAEGLATVDRIEWARVRMNRGRYFLLTGDQKRGLEDFLESLQIDEEEYSIADTARTLVGLGAAYVGSGEAKKAIASEMRAIALFEDLQDIRGQMDAYNRAGQMSPGLDLEAVPWLTRAIKIGLEIGDYNRASEASSSLARIYEVKGDLEQALSESLHSLEYSKETDSTWIKGLAYSNLVRLYSKLGDLKKAEEYFGPLTEMSRVGLVYKLIDHDLSEAVLLAAKNQWTEAMQSFKSILDWTSKTARPRGIITVNYIWALNRQGQNQEAMRIIENIRPIIDHYQKMWSYVDIQPYFMAPNQVGVGQLFEARLDIVNVSRKPCSLVSIAGLLSPEFKTSVLEKSSIRDDLIYLENGKIEPFKVATVKLGLQSEKMGRFSFKPQVFYIDDNQEMKKQEANIVSITVGSTIHTKINEQEFSVPIVQGRITTGFSDLDALLLGGIPENYSIMLLASPSDERQQLISRFLETGSKSNEPTFFVTTRLEIARSFPRRSGTNQYIFICNPQTENLTQESPSLFKLKGVENLTEIDIALVKAYRSLNAGYVGPKRACIEIVSDVLLQHKALTTRKWLSGQLADLKAKGFTILAVIDSQMHTKEEVQSISTLFEGELRVTEREGPMGMERTLKVVRMLNEKFLSQELPLVGLIQGD